MTAEPSTPVGVFVVFLRGINVGGHGVVKMAALRKALVAEGFEGVRTYIQSGNIALRAPGEASDVAARVLALFERDFGFVPRTMVLPESALTSVIASCPYPSEAEAEPKRVHAYFLEEEPTPEAVAQLEAFDAGADRWRLDGRVLYVHTPNGLGTSKLARRIERTLKVPMTARNWRSVTVMVGLAAEVRDAA